MSRSDPMRFGDWVEAGRYWVNTKTGDLLPIIQGGALPATDNFNRAAIGANWTGSVGGDLSIWLSTSAQGASNGDNSMYWNADAPDAAQYTQAKLTKGVVTVIPDYAMVLVRASATDWVGLDAAYAESKWKIEWYNSGSWTQIGSDYATAPADTNIAKLTANGTTFKGYVNGTERISGTNVSAPSSGYGGLYIYGNATNGWDDFEVGNLEAAAGIPNKVIMKNQSIVRSNFW